MYHNIRIHVGLVFLCSFVPKYNQYNQEYGACGHCSDIMCLICLICLYIWFAESDKTVSPGRNVIHSNCPRIKCLNGSEITNSAAVEFNYYIYICGEIFYFELFPPNICKSLPVSSPWGTRYYSFSEWHKTYFRYSWKQSYKVPRCIEITMTFSIKFSGVHLGFLLFLSIKFFNCPYLTITIALLYL